MIGYCHQYDVDNSYTKCLPLFEILPNLQASSILDFGAIGVIYIGLLCEINSYIYMINLVVYINFFKVELAQ